MIAGHFATAMIAKQKFPKGSLLFFLIASQFQDLLWLVFHYLGLEPTGPSDVFDATLSNVMVEMTYSHDVVPQLFWGGMVFLIGRFLFASTTIGLVGLALYAGHFILDFFSGFPHHIFGEHTHQVGLGFYETNVYLAILIEAVFIAAALWYYFAQEAKAGIKRSHGQTLAIIGVYVYSVLYLAAIATTSIREWFNLPEFDIGFNTSVPTLIFTYLALIWVLLRAVPVKAEAN